MNSWSLLYDEMHGNLEPEESDLYTFELELTEKTVYKYNEDKILQDVKDYIGDTYRAHYNSGNGIQTLDLIDSCGDAAAFCRSNILKYASRYDKKGSAKMDLKKIIHYAVLLYHFTTKDSETDEQGYETF
jgi:hypothetical protein